MTTEDDIPPSFNDRVSMMFAGMALGILIGIVAAAIDFGLSTDAKFNIRIITVAAVGFALIGIFFTNALSTVIEWFMHFLLGFFSVATETDMENEDPRPISMQVAIVAGAVAGFALLIYFDNY